MIDVVLLALPLLYFGWQTLRRRGERLAYLLVGFYAYPLLAVTAMNADGLAMPGAVLSDEQAAAIRVVLHPTMTAVLLLGVLVRRRVVVSPATVPAVLTVAWMGLSVAIVQPDAGIAGGLRVVMTLLVVVNALCLVPSVVGTQDRAHFTATVARSCIVLAVFWIAISVYAVARYGFYPPWSPRLSRPLNAAVLAYVVCLGLVATYLRPSSTVLRCMLVFALFLPASRINLAAGVFAAGVGLLYLAGSSWRAVRRGFVLLVMLMAGAVWGATVLERTEVEANPFARSSALSGRESVWRQSLDRIEQAPFFGAGDRVMFEGERGAGDQGRRAHNFALEQAMGYGFPAAMFALSVYAVLFVRALRRAPDRSARWGVVALACLVGLNAMFATGAWTNLGDGTAIVVFLLVAPLTVGARRGVPAARRHGSPLVAPHLAR